MPPIIDRVILMIRLQDNSSLEQEIISDPTFAKNSRSKKYFLAACKCINPHVDLYDVKVKCPFGGLIGLDDSQLECIFSF